MPELLCPGDRRYPLKHDTDISDLNTEYNGNLSCRSGHEYPVKRNIIDLLPEHRLPGGSVANFSNHLGMTASVYEESWRSRSIGTLTGQSFSLHDETDLLIRWTRPYAGGKVVDVGASTGIYSRSLSAEAPQEEIYALDFSEAMLREAVRRGAAENVRFYPLRADAGQLPFFDHQIDLLVCGGTYNELADPEQVLREMRRVLKPEGACFIMYLTRAETLAGRMLQTGAYPGGVAFPKAKTARRAFEDAGFTIQKTQSLGIVTFQLLR